jgi:5-methylcytosine-specific restriction protein B
MAQFDWVEFYGEFARTLLKYKNNRQTVIDNIIAVYNEVGINLPTLEKDNNIIDIDPFNVFGLFNKSKLKLSNRLAIIKGLAAKFGVKATIPESFDSVPTLNNQNATYYWFVGDRGPDDINNLWGLLDTALAYAQNPSADNRAAVSKYFDIVINTKGNANSKISMGLYWIAPDVFLNLDSRNEWYIYESGKIPADIVEKLPKIEPKIAASKYFDIIEVLTAFLKAGKVVYAGFKSSIHKESLNLGYLLVKPCHRLTWLGKLII